MAPSVVNRRDFLGKMMSTGAGTLIAGEMAREKVYGSVQTPSLENKSVMMVWGGWKGHEPKKCVDVFAPWMEGEGATVRIFDTLDAYLDRDLMSSVDLVVQAWTMGTITREHETALLQAVRGGVGIAGWHGGLVDSFRQNVEYQFMVGGQWVAHPGGVIDYDVTIVDGDDPVTSGITDFRVHSEQYYVHVDPNVKVLATTRFSGEHASWIEGSVVPVAWKKMYGKGRVFYSSLGHVASDFDLPEVAEITRRGIAWAGESKYHPREKWIQPVYDNRAR